MNRKKLLSVWYVWELYPSDLKLVEDAINKISVPEINVQVELEAISIANYDNQLANGYDKRRAS